jgi:hypothetical protein
MESFRVLIHIAAALDWDIQQVDIKTAFLYGRLNPEEVCYMEQPDGFPEPGFEDHVWELQKGLYGMKQAGRIWNRTMHARLVELGFVRLPCEYCLYLRQSPSGTILTGIHVDDFICIASDAAENARFKLQLKEAWQIADLGEAKFCIGIMIERDRSTRSAFLSQTALIDRIITQFGMKDAHPASTPMDSSLKLSRREHSPLTDEDKLVAASLPYRSLVGSLMYVAIGTRPDIAYAVQQLSQFLDCYGTAHFTAAKRVVRYLKGTRTLRLHLGGRKSAHLLGYTDAGFANCLDTRKSIGGYCFSLGSGMISWCARKQKNIATSTCEAEYYAASDATKELMWLRALLLAMDFPQTSATTLLCDNNGAIVLSGDPSFHSRTKHIDVRYHYIRECVDNKSVTIEYVHSDENIADSFTKPLTLAPFQRLRTWLGVK